MEYYCVKCNKEYASYQSLWIHNKKFHPINNKSIDKSDKLHDKSIDKPKHKNYKCNKCNKNFIHYQSRWKHEKKCKINKDDKNNETKEINNKINILTEKIKILENKPTTVKNIIQSTQNETINNQLINIIVDKTKTIEKLKNNKEHINEKVNNEIIKPVTLILNNVIIISRTDDNYINATQLCQAGGKKFNDWYRLETTNNLINELESETGIPASQLIDTKKGNSTEFLQGSWIHPDLAIQIAQWISSKFALQVSKWIRTLFSNGKTEINIKLLKDKEKEIILKDQKIQLLQDMYVKKQQRKDYPQKNVIYLLTTEDNKKNRNYIIGKAKELKNRLSSYNKTAEHEVVYYKECKSEESMNIVEMMILNKLNEYREKANRDRFILPIEKDISLFTNIIDSAINYF